MEPSLSNSDVSPLNVVTSLSDGELKLSASEQKERDEYREQRNFLTNICKTAFRHSSDSRRRYDYEWMVRDLFRRGYMFSKYQPSTMTVTLASRQSAKIPINIVRAQMRSIANQVTSFDPKFEIMPRNSTPESETNARYSGKLLDFYFDHLKMRKKIKETVIQGLMYSVGGPWQIVYDAEKKEVVIWELDPYDFYFDPLAEDLDDAEYCIKAVKRPLGEVIYNEEYDKFARSEIRGGESRLATSEYKQFMLQALKYTTQYNTKESPTVILFEGYFRIHEEGEKPHLRKVVWTDQNSLPLVYEDLDENEYDFAIYQADLNPKEIYGEGWMKHVMPLNRVLNSLESSVFDYNYKVAKGRIVVDKDSGIRAIHNVHGEIISKKRGAEVRALDMPPLPIATQSQIERIYKYQEDISGVHDPSLGRLPPGARSGTMLAEMKQSDSSSQQDFVDNLEDFLTVVAQKLLKKIAENYTTVKVIQDLGNKGEDAKYFAVVGEKYKSKKTEDKNKFKIGPDFVDLVQIGKDNQIRVTIGSWLGYTKEMMQEKTLKLLQLNAIDQSTFLKLWEFGDVDKIVQETRKKDMLKSIMNKPQGDVKTVDPYVENDMMVLERKPVMPDPHDDHWVHITVHQDALGQGADDLVGRHIEAHQTYLKSEQGIDMTPDQPAQPDMGMGGQPPMGGAPPTPGINPADQGRQNIVQGQQPPMATQPQPGDMGGGTPMGQ
jgi:hypothetical protein